MSNALDKWNQVSEDVYVPRAEGETGVISIGTNEITELKLVAARSARRRARICAHMANSDLLHQMVLVIQKESYIRPHRHHGKVESFHLIEGEMDVVIFSDDGEVIETIPMCAYPKTSGAVFYRLSKDLYHTLIIHSPYVVFQEITQGPFDVSKTDHALWAPAESDVEMSSRWVENLKKECQHA